MSEKPATKRELMMNFIRENTSNPEMGLLLTRENFAKAREAMNISYASGPYDALKALDEIHGCITRETTDDGVVVRIVSEPKKKASASRPAKAIPAEMTLSELLEKTIKKIETLEREIADLKMFRRQLESMMKGGK